MADFDFTQLKGRMAQAGKGGHVELSDLERNALINNAIDGGGGSVDPEEVQELIDESLEGYYNKFEVDSELNTKSDKSDTYTKSEVDTALSTKANQSTTYTKTEVNNLIPSVDNDIIIGALPSSGVSNTIYRVPGTNSYTDYAWDGTQFVALGTFTGNGDIDATPTEGSTSPVQSGGVYNAVEALHTKIIDGDDVWDERQNILIAKNGGLQTNTSYDAYVIENKGYTKISGYASTYVGYPLVAFYNNPPTNSTLVDKISATTTAQNEYFSYNLNDTIKYIAISYAHAASSIPSVSLSIDVDLVGEIDNINLEIDNIEGLIPSSEDNPEFLFAEEDSDGNVLRGLTKDEEVHYMPQRFEDKVILSKKAYQSLVESIAKFQIPEISIVEFGEKEIVFSNADATATTMDDLRCQNYSIIKNPDGIYYMYYLGCGSEGYRFWDNTTAQYAPYSVLFAHSEDGVNWTRGFPQGVTPPYSNYPNSIKFTDNDGNIINSLYGPVLRVNDSEYPYRMITTEGNVIMMFSRDGFTWDKSVVIDGTQSRDTVSGAVVRGDVIKIYTRGWSGNYPPGAVNGYGQRMIVVLYCDIYGRKLSPAVPFVDRASNYNAPLAVLDDRREIIFPTLYQGENYNAIANCYIIDGINVRQLALDNDFLMNSGDSEHPWKSVWFVGGLFYENNKFYAYYNAFDVVHNQLASANANGRLYRVEVKLKSRVVTNVEQIN